MNKRAFGWLVIGSEYATSLRVLFTAAALYFCVSKANAAALNVMVNESVMLSALNRTELRQIFTGHRQYWSDGTKITVFVLQDNDELHKQFCREILQMFPYQLSRLWDQITYSGQGVTPVRVLSHQALVDALEGTNGAIGYIGSNGSVKLRPVEVSE